MALSGSFEFSSVPEPDPPVPPRYIGDIGDVELGDSRGLEHQLDAELDPREDEIEEPQTVELEPPLGAPALGVPAAASSDAHFEEPELDDDGFHSVGVKIGEPVQESGPWRHETPLAEDDYAAQTSSAKVEAIVVPRAARTSAPIPWSLITAILVIAAAGGFTVGLLNQPAGSSAIASPTDGSRPLRLQTAEELADEADRLHKQGNFAAGLQRIEDALERDPEYLPALMLRAVILTESGRHEDALATVDRALTLSPDEPQAHLKRAVIMDEKGQHGDAITSYERFLALAPDSFEAAKVRQRIAFLRSRLPPQ
jgi:cytochrome c-type biogenesis protein CcmH/NrfG